MSIFNTSRYLKAIFWGLPMGILSLYYGGKALTDIKQDVNDYSYTHGVVDSIYDARIKISINSKRLSNTVMVQLNDSNFYVMSANDISAVINSLNTMDTISVWYQVRETGNKKIKAIQRGEESIIKYEPGGYWVGILFMLWGLFWLVISVLYVVKHPEDLFGGKKEKESD